MEEMVNHEFEEVFNFAACCLNLVISPVIMAFFW